MAHPIPPPYAVRPGAPRTLGLLAVIFGWIVAVTSVMSLLGGGRFTTGDDGDFPPEAAAAFSDATQAASVGLSLIMLVMSATLVSIGAAMRRYKRWSGRAAARWSVGALVIVGAIGYVNGAVIGPAAARLFAAAEDPTKRDAASLLRWAGLGSLLVYAPFPLILIGFLRRPGFVASLDQP